MLLIHSADLTLQNQAEQTNIHWLPDFGLAKWIIDDMNLKFVQSMQVTV